jgi:DNA-binding YbaB/EbfC family protein
MAKGYSARGGFGGSQGQMMRQQQMQQKIMQMQQQMAKAQEDVENTDFTASAGGGAVQAVVSGKKELKALTIQPDAVDPQDVEMLQDLVISAVNEALRQADEAMNNSMNSFTGGLNVKEKEERHAVPLFFALAVAHGNVVFSEPPARVRLPA